MEFRTPQFNEFGSIDCEINHPKHGWIPTTVSEADKPDWFAQIVSAGVAAYVAPVYDPAAAKLAWRQVAVASQPQIRLTLLQMGLLTTVQAMADADPEASIAWEYATEIRRASPFIDALKGEAFTDAQIDDIFTYAMALQL